MLNDGHRFVIETENLQKELFESAMATSRQLGIEVSVDYQEGVKAGITIAVCHYYRKEEMGKKVKDAS
ncbi:MAG: hypothetical protein ISR65_19215 [Bacteriovoracaceae bacterium]|nr:hypothetical protein [Bacteriovoracaceae bacterium]